MQLKYSIEANPKTDIQIIVMVDHGNDLNQFFVLNGWTIAKYLKEKKIKEEKLMTSYMSISVIFNTHNLQCICQV